jgi:RNA polymerase sigma-70 factor (ECF subfamily)
VDRERERRVVDQQLVERAQRGDRDAYERLARASADRMYAVAYQITRDRDRADDALQQALVAMWRDLPSLRDASRFEGWTYRLVTRACLTELRGRRRATIVDLPPDEAVAGPGDFAADVALRDQLQRALATLTPDHRAIIVLRHLTGMSLEEIAEVLAVPYGTVASRLHHATRALRAAVESGDRTPAMGGQPA